MQTRRQNPILFTLYAVCS